MGVKLKTELKTQSIKPTHKYIYEVLIGTTEIMHISSVHKVCLQFTHEIEKVTGRIYHPSKEFVRYIKRGRTATAVDFLGPEVWASIGTGNRKNINNLRLRGTQYPIY